MKNVTFPIIIKEGQTLVTFTDEFTGTYESGVKCVSFLSDYLIRVESGKAEIVNNPASMILVTHTGFEVASGKTFAYFNGGQFEISADSKLNIDWSIRKSGFYRVSRQWFDLFDGEKYEY